jgi:hypothetical protein
MTMTDEEFFGQPPYIRDISTILRVSRLPFYRQRENCSFKQKTTLRQPTKETGNGTDYRIINSLAVTRGLRIFRDLKDNSFLSATSRHWFSAENPEFNIACLNATDLVKSLQNEASESH